jgi:excisionase family DNA binding protein
VFYNEFKDLPLLLTPREVAALLRTSRRVVYEMVRLGRLPGVIRLGRRVLIRRDRLLRFLRESSVSPLGGDE